MLDCVFENARIIDGTGNPWSRGDVGVSHGTIVKVARRITDSASRRIDVAGAILAPGFIDVHAHSDFSLFWDPGIEYKLTQGITTEICGNCGISGFPVRNGRLTRMQADVCGKPGFEATWDSAGEYIDAVRTRAVGTNLGFLVGYNTLRQYVAGLRQQLTAEESDLILELIDAAMAAGAMGLSSGLVYEPGNYAGADELVEACRVVARRRGIYTTHTRGLRETLVDGVVEAIKIAESAQVPVQISHLMPQFGGWDQLEPAIAAVEAARTRGVDVAFDVHLDTIGGTSGFATLPPWLKEGGVGAVAGRLSTSEDRSSAVSAIRDFVGPGTSGFLRHSRWDLLWVSQAPASPECVGKRLSIIAADQGKAPWDAYLDLLIANGEGLQLMGVYTRVEELRRALSNPLSMVATDAVPLVPGSQCATPRNYSTIPKLLGRYVREEGLLSLEAAVQKITSKPASRFGLTRRGLIAEGFRADLVVFDSERVTAVLTDEAVLEGVECRQPNAPGMIHVMVNGVFEIEDGSVTGELGGQVILGEAK